MVFSSKIFLFFFFPMLYLLYFTEIKKGKVNSIKYQNIVLLIASLVFYAYGGPIYALLLIVEIVLDYLMALLMDKQETQKKRKLFLILTIIINVGILFVFKYLSFFVKNIGALFGSNIGINIVLPIGISFYTFQLISYVVDVYRKRVEANKSFIELALYVSMFPQLIAGPIVRYEDVCVQIKTRTSNSEDITYGFIRFCVGLSKKVLLADYLAKVADYVFLRNQFEKISVTTAWLGALAYMLQIYFDFSGYSDMAIGLARIFGFKLRENFNYPYISKSVTEFWRRWHISLSEWLKDYIYIPLGGNRKGKIRRIVNLLIVWVITGFWHGAAWNFLLWGLYYFIWLMIDKYIIDKISVLNSNVVGKNVKWFCTMIIVCVGWVIFKYSSLEWIGQFIGTMFGINGFVMTDIHGAVIIKQYGFIILIACIASLPVKTFIDKKIKSIKAKEILLAIYTIGVIALSILSIFVETYSPFIYFQF